MGEHKYNPVAQANRGPKQMVQAMDLGEDTALLGVMLRPWVDEVAGELVIGLLMVGGHASPILGGVVPREVPVGELVRLPLAKVREVLKGSPPPVVDAPGAGNPDEAPAGGEPEVPRLILGGRTR